MKLTLTMLALTLLALGGCGGGDPEDDRRTTEPVNCGQPGANRLCTHLRAGALRLALSREVLA